MDLNSNSPITIITYCIKLDFRNTTGITTRQCKEETTLVSKLIQEINHAECSRKQKCKKQNKNKNGCQGKYKKDWTSKMLCQSASSFPKESKSSSPFSPTGRIWNPGELSPHRFGRILEKYSRKNHWRITLEMQDPITRWDVEIAFMGLKDSCPGLDGMRKSHLRNLSSDELPHTRLSGCQREFLLLHSNWESSHVTNCKEWTLHSEWISTFHCWCHSMLLQFWLLTFP